MCSHSTSIITPGWCLDTPQTAPVKLASHSLPISNDMAYLRLSYTTTQRNLFMESSHNCARTKAYNKYVARPSPLTKTPRNTIWRSLPPQCAACSSSLVLILQNFGNMHYSMRSTYRYKLLYLGDALHISLLMVDNLTSSTYAFSDVQY